MNYGFFCLGVWCLVDSYVGVHIGAPLWWVPALGAIAWGFAIKPEEEESDE